MVRALLIALWVAALGFGQVAEYDFYSAFRPWLRELREKDRSLTQVQLLERYAAKLRSEGIAEEEISRRNNLLRTSRDKLEDDFWNRFFTEGKSVYNTAPNAFLVQIVQGRTPGSALDFGMGAGRNAIYLAKLGWKVAGFDPAAEAVASAQKQAKELGLSIDTAPVRDSEYDFGKDRFDLVLFSWTMPTGSDSIRKVTNAIKPNGIVVVECGADWVGRNAMLKMFDSLQIIHYEIVTAQSDFFDRKEMEVLRLVARKPEP